MADKELTSVLYALQLAFHCINNYYIKPMHRQEAFFGVPSSAADCTVTEQLRESVLCLPIHPYLEESEVERISSALLEFIA